MEDVGKGNGRVKVPGGATPIESSAYTSRKPGIFGNWKSADEQDIYTVVIISEPLFCSLYRPMNRG